MGRGTTGRGKKTWSHNKLQKYGKFDYKRQKIMGRYKIIYPSDEFPYSVPVPDKQVFLRYKKG